MERELAILARNVSRFSLSLSLSFSARMPRFVRSKRLGRVNRPAARVRFVSFVRDSRVRAF